MGAVLDMFVLVNELTIQDTGENLHCLMDWLPSWSTYTYIYLGLGRPSLVRFKRHTVGDWPTNSRFGGGGMRDICNGE